MSTPRAHAHQVARPVVWQLRTGVLEHRVALGFGFTHCQAADRVTVESNLLEALQRTRAQIAVNATLDDAE
jgi:cytochrome oxidase Cu insertion factor (SCO1/SenC/PrrC family)